IIWTSLPGRDSNDLRDWRIRAALRPSRNGCGGARCDLSATFGREKSNPAIDPPGGRARAADCQVIDDCKVIGTIDDFERTLAAMPRSRIGEFSRSEAHA